MTLKINNVLLKFWSLRMNGLTNRRMSFPKIILPLTFGILLIVLPEMASANRPANITEAEMKLLPRYCPDTMGFNYGDAYTNTSPRAKHWVALMGKGFWAMHHYCWALINLPRALRSGVTAQFKRGTLEGVRSDYQFVIAHTTADFIMLPEVFSRLGEVELMLANPNGADNAFTKARELKPDYWPAYSHWAEFLIRSGKRAEAKKLIQTGLEYSPTAKVLLEQYRMVGGKPSEIVPRAKEPKPEGDDSIPTEENAGSNAQTELPHSTKAPE